MRRPTYMSLAVLIALGMALPAFADASYRLSVNGISCPFCAYGIEKELGKLDGVVSVSTDIADGVVVVDMADGAVLERAVAEQAVTKAGFTLKEFVADSADASRPE